MTCDLWSSAGRSIIECCVVMYGSKNEQLLKNMCLKRYHIGVGYFKFLVVNVI